MFDGFQHLQDEQYPVFTIGIYVMLQLLITIYSYMVSLTLKTTTQNQEYTYFGLLVYNKDFWISDELEQHLVCYYSTKKIQQ